MIQLSLVGRICSDTEPFYLDFGVIWPWDDQVPTALSSWDVAKPLPGFTDWYWSAAVHKSPCLPG